MRRPVAVFEMLCVRACMPCSESLGELFAARGASGVIPRHLGGRRAFVLPAAADGTGCLVGRIDIRYDTVGPPFSATSTQKLRKGDQELGSPRAEARWATSLVPGRRLGWGRGREGRSGRRSRRPRSPPRTFQRMVGAAEHRARDVRPQMERRHHQHAAARRNRVTKAASRREARPARPRPRVRRLARAEQAAPPRRRAPRVRRPAKSATSRRARSRW